MNLRNEHGWPMHSHEIRPLLGLKPGHHLPAEGMPSQFIGNVEVWLLPKTTNTKKHRIVCHCPVCDEVTPAGRLAQHLKVHNG